MGRGGLDEARENDGAGPSEDGPSEPAGQIVGQ